MSVSNSVFVGFANTECSLLKFVGELLDGETKEELPKWIGIDNIQEIFSQTKDKINGLTNETKDNLDNNKRKTDTSKNNFEDALERFSLAISLSEPFYHAK